MERTTRAVLGALMAGLAVTVVAPLAPARAQAGTGSVSLTALGSTVEEEFDSLANTGTTNTTLPVGWYLEEDGTNANDQYAAGTGSSTTGDIYSFGASATTERAFGTLRSGSLIPTIGAAFTNNTGSQISALDVDYVGEQWRLGALPSTGTPPRGPDQLDFQYSLDATSLTTGNWTDVDALNFTSPTATPVGLLDGNDAANRTAIAATISGLAVAPGATFWVRWSDANPASSDDGLAVDDFNLTPQVGVVADTAPSVTATSPNNGATNVAVAANLMVTFSEAVDVVDPWFSISCTTTGAHAATVSGGPTTFTVDPDTDFANNETCTVTVLASGVTDQDANDPPDSMAADFVFSFTTAEAFLCGAAATFIHEIQGSGAATPVPGVRTIEGIVVGDYQGTGQFDGYYLQEEVAHWDANTLTSEGIFVFSSSPVSLGDAVRVSGTAGESFGLTRISAVEATAICSTGNALPTATVVTFPVAAVSDLERYEGMSISISQELTVTEVFTLGRFGEVSLSTSGRLDTPTNVVEPGAPAIALQDLNDRSRIVLDDGNGRQNLDPTFYPDGGLSATNTLRVGDTLPSLSGILDFRFNLYRVQPINADAITFTSTNPRPAEPPAVGGNLRVAAFNVLNYFNGDGAGGAFPTPRGANNLIEFNRQRDKIISALVALDGDVVGLMELENDATAGDQVGAIEDLVAGLNAATAPETYAFIDTGVVGTDQIRVGIIYQPAAVTPLGAHAIMNSTVDPRFIDTLNRPSIAQTFQLNATGETFTAVVNHLKSKGSACAGDPDTGDGQGNCNTTRTAAAEALVDWLATDPTGSGDPDVIVLGDLNGYAMEDPIDVFRDAGFVDTIAEFDDDGYSYVFAGQSGYLDHALASPSLAAQISDVGEWHINADEPIVLDYNTEFKTPNHVTTLYAPGPYRSSDHDPVLVGINLDAPSAPPTVDAGGPYSVVEGGTVEVTATGTDDGSLTYAWDLDGNGSFETPGQTVTFSAGAIQAPASGVVTVEVTDEDGLTATDTATVTVIWDFDGFFGLADPPTLNMVRTGKNVAISFSLDGNQGQSVLAGAPTSRQIDCSSGAVIGPAEAAASTGKGGISYSAATDRYSFLWKTSKFWLNTCRQFTVTLADGTVHVANFQFVR